MEFKNEPPHSVSFTYVDPTTEGFLLEAKAGFASYLANNDKPDNSGPER